MEAGKAEYGCTVPGEARQRGQDMGIIGDCGVQPQPSPTRTPTLQPLLLPAKLDIYISNYSIAMKAIRIRDLCSVHIVFLKFGYYDRTSLNCLYVFVFLNTIFYM